MHCHLLVLCVLLVWVTGSRYSVADHHREQDLFELTKITRNKKLWRDVDSTIQQASRGNRPNDKDLSVVTTALVATIMFKSTQRSGALLNVTLSEYERSKVIEDHRVIKVAHHKTSVTGTAKLVAYGKDMQRLDQYVNLLQPLVDPMGTLPNLFLYPGPITIATNLGYRMKKLGDAYGDPVPSSTAVRKAATTAASATLVDSEEMTKVVRQMSHSRDTSRRYYQLDQGTADAVDAYRQVSAMLEDKEQSPPKKQLKQKFTPEEEEEISAHFSDTISVGGRASRSACREFLMVAKVVKDRADKSIQDKVRSLSLSRLRDK